jgi:hypothetical protein
MLYFQSYDPINKRPPTDADKRFLREVDRLCVTFSNCHKIMNNFLILIKLYTIVICLFVILVIIYITLYTLWFRKKTELCSLRLAKNKGVGVIYFKNQYLVIKYS